MNEILLITIIVLVGGVLMLGLVVGADERKK